MNKFFANAAIISFFIFASSFLLIILVEDVVTLSRMHSWVLLIIMVLSIIITIASLISIKIKQR